MGSGPTSRIIVPSEHEQEQEKLKKKKTALLTTVDLVRGMGVAGP